MSRFDPYDLIPARSVDWQLTFDPHKSDAALPGKGASIYDVQTEWGGGSTNIPNLGTNSIDFADRGLVKKSQNLVDVVYGIPPISSVQQTG